MGAVPSHGITMGYVSDPFRTEEQNPDTEGQRREQFVRLHFEVILTGIALMIESILLSLLV
jgi:hypothetical protein